MNRVGGFGAFFKKKIQVQTLIFKSISAKECWSEMWTVKIQMGSSWDFKQQLWLESFPWFPIFFRKDWDAVGGMVTVTVTPTLETPLDLNPWGFSEICWDSASWFPWKNFPGDPWGRTAGRICLGWSMQLRGLKAQGVYWDEHRIGSWGCRGQEWDQQLPQHPEESLCLPNPSFSLGVGTIWSPLLVFRHHT